MNDAEGLVMSGLSNGFGSHHDSSLLSNGSASGFPEDLEEFRLEEPSIIDVDYHRGEDNFARKRRKQKTDEVQVEAEKVLTQGPEAQQQQHSKTNGHFCHHQNGKIFDDQDNNDKEEEFLSAHDEFGLGISRCCEAKRRLLRIHDMPDHLKFNQYVHSGYRGVQNAWGCFMSLFYLHNETVNIFTHVIPIIGVMYYWKSMYPWDEIRDTIHFNVLGWSHVMGSISPWMGSVIYHLFMNHDNGPKFYQFLLQVDMLGIWVTQCFGALTNLTASTWCLPQCIQTTWMVIYAIFSIWGLKMAVTAWTPLSRRMCFAPVFISRIFGFALRLSPWGGGDPAILVHVILQDVISVLGGMIGVIRIPEKWFPGKLDMFFNSHHIMHVLVVCAVFHMNWASNGDIRWMLNNFDRSQCMSHL